MINSSFEIVAKTFDGLENILAEEIKSLGGQKVVIGKRAVSYYGDKKLLYDSNLCLRTAVRVLRPIQKFQVRTERQLYDKIYNIKWNKIFDLEQTFAVNAVVHSRNFNHSKYIALKTKDAIVDQFRNRTGKRPNIDTFRPNYRIDVYINGDNVIVSLDSSGDSLHRRGYKTEMHLAPLNEVLAAGLVLLAGWKGDRPLLDPMCGSGTILTEAASIALNLPVNFHRDYFGFQKWNDYDKDLYEKVREEALGRRKTFEGKIYGSDKSFQYVRMAERNLDRLNLQEVIEISRKNFFKMEAPAQGGVIIMNPPYGERLNEKDLLAFYKNIGDVLKQEFEGWEAWLISSNKDAVKNVGLRTSKKVPLYNGPLECRFCKYEMYAGSKKVEIVE